MEEEVEMTGGGQRGGSDGKGLVVGGGVEGDGGEQQRTKTRS